jgi:hypothetical protein
VWPARARFTAASLALCAASWSAETAQDANLARSSSSDDELLLLLLLVL